MFSLPLVDQSHVQFFHPTEALDNFILHAVISEVLIYLLLGLVISVYPAKTHLVEQMYTSM